MCNQQMFSRLLLVLLACAWVLSYWLYLSVWAQLYHHTLALKAFTFTGDLELEDNNLKSLCRNNSECLKLHRLIDQDLPIGKPRGAIVMLIGRRVLRTQRFITFLKGFDEYFNNAFKYPLILFHDSNIDETAQKLLRSWTNSSLYFQPVNFVTPPNVNESQVTDHCYGGLRRHTMAYRHMCRFHANTIIEEPILASDKLEYVLRLDDDSVFHKPINYDMFAVMSSRKLQYGYASITNDDPDCVIGLEDSVLYYFNLTGAHQKFPWKMPQMYYNNFELSDIKLWRSAEYRHYVNYIDFLGGIYRCRWGDAPIKSIFVSFFVEKSATHQFSDIGYSHQGGQVHEHLWR